MLLNREAAMTSWLRFSILTSSGLGMIIVCHVAVIIEGTPEQLDQFCWLKGFGICYQRVDQLDELSNVFPDVRQLDGHGFELIVKVQTRPRLKLVQLSHELSADVTVGHVDDDFNASSPSSEFGFTMNRR